jgi:hypothetical protein
MARVIHERYRCDANDVVVNGYVFGMSLGAASQRLPTEDVGKAVHNYGSRISTARRRQSARPVPVF